ncbi:HIT family protein [Verticiella sediminum]|uniref:HIT family protein n=1 Tax=Verticiella sediminum TaxID=1247510 RepID=A0A556ALR4_9BURK|nr:HIT family protein [Verticiella sediminum]TSH93828.1 HIT family protein [Verticiella sediminum]
MPQHTEFIPPAGGIADCPLCQTAGGEIVWSNALARVVLVDDPAQPGYTRVVLHAHHAEMTDLPAAQRTALMALVWRVERVLRDVLQPDKVNLAALGNMVPHVHWHIIPRWRDDPAFPDAIWAPARREPASDEARLGALGRYREALAAALDAGAAPA